jgi:multidrug efflux system outer membrane protein
MRGLTILVAATIVSLAACRTIETKLPPVELPETSVQSLPGAERWWTQFNDPQLNALIEEAFAANLDLRVAMARIEEARANMGVARFVSVSDGQCLCRMPTARDAATPPTCRSRDH